MKATDVKVTKKWLEERCTKDDKHLLWTLSCGGGGPRGYVRNAEGRESQFSVRHAAYALWRGEHPGPGKTVRPSCGIHNCLAKGCLEVVVHGGYNRGRQRSLLTRQRIAETVREKSGYPQHVVQAIKDAGDRPAKELAAELGVGLCTVYDIRSGARWRDYTSPIGGMAAQLLGARNA